MSSDSEKKGSTQHFAAAPQFPPGANMQFQPVYYYQPVPYDVATSVNGEEQQAFLQPEGEKKCFFHRICRRWRDRKCASKCAVVDDGRALGNLNNFIAGLLFGTLSPFFSLLCVFGFESKKLTRTGTLFGHANFFLILALSLIAFGTGSYTPHRPHGGEHGIDPFFPFPVSNTTVTQNATDLAFPQGGPQGVPQGGPFEAGREDSDDEHDQKSDDSDEKNDSNEKSDDDDKKGEHDEKEGQSEKKKGKHGDKKEHGRRKKGCKMFKISVGASFVVGFIFLIISLKSFRRFMAIYRIRENKPESDTVKVVSEAGNCRGFFLGLIASFLWPMVGTALILIIRRKNLTSRYGALHGLGIFFVFIGVAMAFHGVPPFAVLKGLLLCQISAVHFKRAIASANALEAKATNC
jgi:hypothetical protein